jgi:hypothetical protein
LQNAIPFMAPLFALCGIRCPLAFSQRAAGGDSTNRPLRLPS